MQRAEAATRKPARGTQNNAKASKYTSYTYTWSVYDWTHKACTTQHRAEEKALVVHFLHFFFGMSLFCGSCVLPIHFPYIQAAFAGRDGDGSKLHALLQPTTTTATSCPGKPPRQI